MSPERPPIPTDLIPPTVAATLAQVTVKTVRRWVEEERISCYRTLTGRIRLSRA